MESNNGGRRPWREPGEGEKSGYGTWKRPSTPYDQFMESQGIPIVREIGISRVQDLTLAPWERMGGNGAFIQLDGTEGIWGMYIIEIPPGKALHPEKHLYEEIFFVVEGRGTTEVWQTDEQSKQVFEWSAGSVFSIPLNAQHRIVNATNSPALLLAGTTAPNIMNLMRNEEFVFGNDFLFHDRYDQARDYFSPQEEYYPDAIRGLATLFTSYVPDLVGCELPRDNRRSPGYRRVQLDLSKGIFYAFCGEHQVGRYAKAHRHPPGAVLICISGKGYTYTWPSELGTTPWKDGHGDKVERVDYEPVGIVSAAPRNGDWFHQHFSIGPDPLRLLVFVGAHRSHAKGGRPGTENKDFSSISVKDGGWVIEYADQDPHIQQEFERMQALEGGENHMDESVFQATFEFTGPQGGD